MSRPLLVVAVLVLSLLLPSVAHADESVSSQFRALSQARTEAHDHVEELDGELATVAQEIGQASANLARIQAELEAKTAALAADEAELARLQGILVNQAIDAYIGDTQPDAMFLWGDPSAAARAKVYWEVAVGRTTVSAKEVRKLRDQTRRDADDLVDARSRAAELKLALESKQHELEEKRRAQVAERDAAEASLRALLASLGADMALAPPGSGQLGYPLANPVPTSTFGERLDPVLNVVQLHAGMDFAAHAGTPIFAAEEGTVVVQAPENSSGGYGNYTCISHGERLSTCYAHQSEVFPSLGQRVSRGEVIGLVGSTGYSTGPHLHFEVRVAGAPVDPYLYL